MFFFFIFLFHLQRRALPASDLLNDRTNNYRNPDGSETVKITRIVGGEKEETIIQQNPDTPGSGRSGRDGLVQDFNIFDGIERGGRIGENPTEPSVIPPPADKKYSSIFSKFFGN